MTNDTNPTQPEFPMPLDQTTLAGKELLLVNGMQVQMVETSKLDGSNIQQLIILTIMGRINNTEHSTEYIMSMSAEAAFTIAENLVLAAAQLELSTVITGETR